MGPVKIVVRAEGIHFTCRAEVIAADGTVLHQTRSFPHDCRAAAVRAAEDECLRRDWDDTSGWRVRAIRAAEAKIRELRRAARETTVCREGITVYVDDEGYVCGDGVPHTDDDVVRIVRGAPQFLAAAQKLRKAVVALAEVV